MAEKKKLIERYGIPLSHLDFKYVEECNDAREMERIVHILQSGEEGYYPDLTKSAEDKLRLLKPNSRLFRCEVQLLHRDDVSDNELEPIKEFSRKAHDLDKRLLTIEADTTDSLPPIRTSGKIDLNKKEKDEKNETNDAGDQIKTINSNNNAGKKPASTDYRKWDRYDPDVEILSMDLAEERAQEELERMNRLNAKKVAQTPLIEEIKEEDERIRKLTDIERDKLAEEYRLRGNEYFRAKEYDSALTEYTRTITLNPEKDVAAYNNRALTYMRIKKYFEAKRDCEKCLSIDPKNIKAMYRLAQSNMESGCKEKALEMFEKVLELEPNNDAAKKFSKTLRVEIGEPVPSNATRIRITEGPTQPNSTTPIESVSKVIKAPRKLSIKNKKSDANLKTADVPKSNDYDLASLVRPKEVVPNKWMDTAANMIGKNNANDSQKKQDSGNEIKTTENDEKEPEIRLPIFNESTTRSKTLIEEL